MEIFRDLRTWSSWKLLFYKCAKYFSTNRWAVKSSIKTGFPSKTSRFKVARDPPLWFLVVVNMFGWVAILRESHHAMSCHFFVSSFFFFGGGGGLYSICCILSSLNKEIFHYYLDHSKLFLKLNNHNLGVQVATPLSFWQYFKLG